MFQTLHEISKNLIFVFVWKYVWKYININVSDITKKEKRNEINSFKIIINWIGWIFVLLNRFLINNWHLRWNYILIQTSHRQKHTEALTTKVPEAKQSHNKGLAMIYLFEERNTLIPSSLFAKEMLYLCRSWTNFFFLELQALLSLRMAIENYHGIYYLASFLKISDPQHFII